MSFDRYKKTKSNNPASKNDEKTTKKDPLRRGIEPRPPRWERGILTTRLPGNSINFHKFKKSWYLNREVIDYGHPQRWRHDLWPPATMTSWSLTCPQWLRHDLWPARNDDDMTFGPPQRWGHDLWPPATMTLWTPFNINTKTFVYSVYKCTQLWRTFCGVLVNALAYHAGDPSSIPCYHSSVFWTMAWPVS